MRALYPELKQGPLLVPAETTIYGVFLSSSVTFMQSGFLSFLKICNTLGLARTGVSLSQVTLNYVNWPEGLACAVTKLRVHYFFRWVTSLPEGVIVGF